jgi:hypothetical protein
VWRTAIADQHHIGDGRLDVLVAPEITSFQNVVEPEQSRRWRRPQ